MYPLVLAGFITLFIGLHYYANNAPQTDLAKTITRDFRLYNLNSHNYPFSVYNSQSILANTGQNQFTECVVLLSVLTTPGNSIRNAVLPRTAVRTDTNACARLEQVANKLKLEGGTIKTRPLRSRYWWGARTVYSAMLRTFSVYQVRELVRNLTGLAYLGLAIALVYISTTAFWQALPLLVFGVMFSGASYYSEVVLGVPYLWAIVSATVVAALHARHVHTSRIDIVIFALGAISSFLWLLDGHLMLITAWLILLGYLGRLYDNDVLGGLKFATRHVAAFYAGFLASYLAGQLIKAYYVGLGPVFRSVFVGVSYRASDIGPHNSELTLSKVLDTVWSTGYRWTGFWRDDHLWNIAVWSSSIAAAVGLVIGLYRGMRENRKLLTGMLICLLIIGSVFIRLDLLKNHSVIHAFFIGRYMFIPLAMGWVMLIIALTGIGRQSPSSRVAEEN